jgi:2-succinyl-5-enolpyruvyl-6-hydroxy-3-cyclohexene-1-carboxylate synthase
VPTNFKIILINNGGGGIFRILPGHSENETFTKYFETSHNLTAEHLAKMYGFDYYKANNKEQLQTNWKECITNTRPLILEICTPEKENDKILLEYFKKVI